VKSVLKSATEYTTNIPARMDRLPWSRWHWMIVVALGITWILDGLEVTIVGSIASILQKPQALGLSAGQIGMAASGYVAGAVVGALAFGYLTDRLGRKKLFMVTLLIYTVFTICTALSWSFAAFFAFRFLTGIGIGGEYAAINSAIDELIPARRRGQVDLSINSSWWMGTIVASVITLSLLNLIPIALGWRLVFGMGAVLALAVMLVRRYLPESPRWLLTHGRAEEAERVVDAIEAQVIREKGNLPPVTGGEVTIDQLQRVGFGDVVKTMFREYPKRTALGICLMVTQAFLYNAVFFTEALVLTTFFGVSATAVPVYIIPLAIGNLVGPWLLGRYFDTIGRRPMIAGSYILAGALLVVTGLLFRAHALDATTITLCWGVIFFFASAGASAAYLTGSEIFPMEARAVAIAFVYAIGTLAGGVAAPYLFGMLIQTQSVDNVFLGYAVGAALMILGGLIEVVLGVDAEGKALEEIAAPLTMVGRHKVGIPPVREVGLPLTPRRRPEAS
jgi:MFS family permease